MKGKVKPHSNIYFIHSSLKSNKNEFKIENLNSTRTWKINIRTKWIRQICAKENDYEFKSIMATLSSSFCRWCTTI